MPEPKPFRPVQHYAPGGAAMVDAIEQLDRELNEIKLVLDAHRAALVAAGWLNLDGSVPAPERQPREWRWENKADRHRPVLPADPDSTVWRTRDRHGHVHYWAAGPSATALWDATWRDDLKLKGPMTEVIGDD